jgi:hypothetical protein
MRWSPHPDLNRGPHSYQECALPAELCGPGVTRALVTCPGGQWRIRTTEARAPDLQSGPIVHSGNCPCRCALPLQTRRSRRWDSNPQPAVYKTAALPIELRRHAQPDDTVAPPDSIGIRSQRRQGWQRGSKRPRLAPCRVQEATICSIIASAIPDVPVAFRGSRSSRRSYVTRSPAAITTATARSTFSAAVCSPK